VFENGVLRGIFGPERPDKNIFSFEFEVMKRDECRRCGEDGINPHAICRYDRRRTSAARVWLYRHSSPWHSAEGCFALS
jgi:hypothetical protein